MIEPGDRLLGSYEIRRLIGRGGMADVFAAWDIRRQHLVAIKVMRADIAEDMEFVRRFRREADVLSRLAHENIVRFYGFERDGLTAFIVMDYVEGTTLRAEIARAEGALPLTQVLSVSRQVCAALGYAHTEGIIHRDVKPGNVLIRPDGHLFLSDFGIARATDATTVTAAMPGTPPYMSPEQCRGDEVDARSDLYSLGVVVYEMLTGRRPFLGEAAGTGSTQERIRWEHLYAAPPPIRRFNPGVPEAAEATIIRALAKDPAERWPDAATFFVAVTQALAPAVADDQTRPASAAVLAAAIAPAPSGAGAASTGSALPSEVAPAPPGSNPPIDAARRIPPGRNGRGVWVASCLTTSGLAVLIVAVLSIGLGPGRAVWSPPSATSWPTVTAPQPSPTIRPPTQASEAATSTRAPSSTPLPATVLPTSTETPEPTEISQPPTLAPTFTHLPPDTSTPTRTRRPPTDIPTPTTTRSPRPTIPPSLTPTRTIPAPPRTSTPTNTRPLPSSSVLFQVSNETRGTLDVFVDGSMVFRVQPGETKSVRVARGLHRIGLCPLGYTNCPSSENPIDISSDPFQFVIRSP